MMRRVWSLFAVAALVGFLPVRSPAATAPPLTGVYDVAGSLSVQASFPKVAKLSLNLYKLELLGEQLTFTEDGAVSDDLLDLSGTWTQAGSKFTVDLDRWIEQTKQELLDLLASEEVGLEGVTVTVTKQSFTGSVGKSGLTGKIAVTFVVAGDFEMAGAPALTVTLSGSLKGTPAEDYVARAAVPRRLHVPSLLVNKVILPVAR